MAWKKGPLPEETWFWGGVVTVDMGSNSGFVFADFKGDHVILKPSNERVEAKNVAYYDNSLEWPIPSEVKES
jgi:hypothetical protein